MLFSYRIKSVTYKVNHWYNQCCFQHGHGTGPRVGGTFIKFHSLIPSSRLYLILKKKMHILSITLIFDKCLCSSAAVTPVKYERDIHQVTSVLMIMKHCEINGMEEFDLVSPIPGLAQQCCTYCELSTKSTLAAPSHYLIQFWLMIVSVQPSAIAENFQDMLATLIIWNDLFKDFYSSARG